MNHCIRCGGELLKINDTKYQCTHCKREQFDSPTAAVAILLTTDKNKVILARRAKEPEKGKLDPIGGFLDNSENIETALYRELEEETGLNQDDITDVTYLGSVHNYYDWNGHHESVAPVYFTAKLKPGKQLEAADDVASFEELPLAEIDYSELAWPEIGDMLDKLKNT